MTDLLDYGRPPALQLEEGALGEVIARALRPCEPMAADAGVVVDLHLAPDLPRMRLDRRGIEQAGGNLVANALQHSPRGGCVRVTAERRDAATVECRVEDDGAGIPEG